MSTSQPTAILVNDDATQLRILSALLKRAGFVVHPFSSAELAYAELASGAVPALVVTDLHMPGIDGWRFCRLLRASEQEKLREVPILVVSATFAGEESVRVTADTGANAFLPSPVDVPRFLATVQALMRGEFPRHAPRALIVERNLERSEAMAACFRRSGYAVECCHAMGAGLEPFAASAFDLVVVEETLEDGIIEAIDGLSTSGSPRPVLVVIGNSTSAQSIFDLMKRGAAAFVRIPFDCEDLVRLCEAVSRERALLHVKDLLERSALELQRHEARQRDILESQRELICVWRTDTTIQYVNHAFCVFYGKSREELVGQPFTMLREAMELEEARANAKTPGAPTPTPHKESACYGSDLSPKWIQWTDNPLRDSNGNIAEFVSVGWDVTSKMSAQEELHSSREMLRVCLDAIPQAICWKDRQLRYLGCNRNFSRMVGATGPEAIVGLTDRDLPWTPLHAVRVAARDQSVLASNAPVYHEICDAIMADDERRWFDLCEMPMHDAAGNVSGLVAAYEDITARKTAELHLAHQHALLRCLIDSIPDMIFYKDTSSVFLGCNPAFEAYMGHAENEIIGRTDYDFLPRDIAEFYREKDRVMLAEGRPKSNEEWIEYPDGRKALVETLKTPYYGPDGAVLGLIGLSRDVTEERRIADALREREAQLAMFFNESQEGHFFMMLDEPILWNDSADKEAVLDYVFAHQRITKINKAMLAQYGATEADIMGRTPADFFRHDVDTGRKLWRDLFDLGYGRSTIHERKLDGTPISVDGTYQCLYDTTGRITGLFGVQRETTMQRRADALLKAERDLGVEISDATTLSEKLLICLQKAIHVSEMDAGAVYLVDEVNGGLDMIVHRGLPESFVAGASHYEADSETARSTISGQPVYTKYCNIMSPQLDDGADALKAMAILPVRAHGSVIGCLNVASHTLEDVPAYARVALELIAETIGSFVLEARNEEKIRQSRQDLQTLFDTITDFVFILDRYGNVMSLNSAVGRRLGFSRQKLVGAPLRMLLPEGRREEFDREVEEFVRNGRGASSIPLVAADGAEIPVDTVVERGRWAGKDVLVAISRDITERKRAEAERIEMERRFAMLQKWESLGRMAGSIAHHFNSINTAILVGLDILEQDMAATGADIEGVRQVQFSASRAVDLSRLMLAYVGQGYLDRSRADISSLARVALQQFDLSPYPAVRIADALATGLPEIKIAIEGFSKVVGNLVQNACEACEHQPGIITVSTGMLECEAEELRAAVGSENLPTGKYLYLEVADTGAGMNADTKARMFDPFFSTRFAGRGLGLATVFGFVRSHAGGLLVKSELKLGTAVRVLLPAIDLSPPG